MFHCLTCLRTRLLFSLMACLPLLCSGDKYLIVFGQDFEGSHMISMTSAAKAMIKRNHSVTLVMPNGRDASIRRAMSNHSYLAEYYKASIPPERDQETLMKWSKLVLNGSYIDIIKFGSNATKNIKIFCEDVLKDQSLLQRLAERHFDLVFVHNVFACPVLIARYLDVRFVVFMPAIPPSGSIRMYSNPVNPAYSPELFTGYSDRMTFPQRLKNTLYTLFHRLLAKISHRYLDELKQKYNIKPEISTFETLSKAEIWFITSDFVLDFPRSYQPNVISVGGITANPAQPLTKDLEDFMQSSGNEGVIVVSMGTYVTAMDTQMVNVFAEAFTNLPQKVVWKSAGQPPTTIPANVKMLEWLPQNDLLGHPRTRLIICQCGINGVFEAIYHSIPVICIPVQSDQWDNAKRLEVKGIGLQLELRSLTSEMLKQAVNTVLRDESYQSNMSRLSSIFHDEHLAASQRTVYWMEKVVRHGGASHLRTSAFDLNVIQYTLIDVFAFLGMVTAVSVLLLIYISTLFCRLLSKCCCNKRERQKTD